MLNKATLVFSSGVNLPIQFLGESTAPVFGLYATVDGIILSTSGFSDFVSGFYGFASAIGVAFTKGVGLSPDELLDE